MATQPEERGAPPGDVTRLLQDIADGQPQAAAELLPLIYGHLRDIARQRMSLERPGHTLQATELVHEAYLRVMRGQPLALNSRGHFFHVAAEAMRRLLTEHARQRGRVKRGGDRRRVMMDVLDLAADQDEEEIVSLDDAVRRLEHVDSDAAEVMRLRFYAGLSLEQTSEALGKSASTIKRDWAFARAWLHQALQGQV